MQPHSLKDCIPDFENFLNTINGLLANCADQQMKFMYLADKFRLFLKSFSKTAGNEAITQKQYSGFSITCVYLHKFVQLLCQHQPNFWAQFTLNSPVCSILDYFYEISDYLEAGTKDLDEKSSKYFCIDRNKWQELHMKDLFCIKASLEFYLQNQNPDLSSLSIVKKRLISINQFISMNNHDSQTNDKGSSQLSPINYHSWIVDLNDYNIIKPSIGDGISSQVYKGISKKDGSYVAIKELKANFSLSIYQREIAVLSSLNFPTLLKFIGATEDSPLCIITEYLPKGSLFDDLHKNHQLNATMRTIAAFDIARGIQYLHSNHIIHRDLKSLNILIDEDLHIRICDFGYARKDNESSHMTQNVGTIQWMAPELFNRNGFYTSKVDIFSYGILLWELVTQNEPYKGMEASSIPYKVLQKNLRPPLSDDEASIEVRSLISRCWDFDPDKRPNCDEIIEEFLSGKIIFEGADPKQVNDYIRLVTGFSDSNKGQNCYDIRDFNKILTIISEKGIPDEFLHDSNKLQILFDNIENKILQSVSNDYSPNSPSHFEMDDNEVNFSNISKKFPNAGIILCRFLSTDLKSRAACLLKQFPANSINTNTICDLYKNIKTEFDDFADDISVIACKNGGAEFIALYGFEKHLKLALEVIARQGVVASYKVPIIDKCVANQSSNDIELACASLRCLVGLNETGKISCSLILQYLQSPYIGMRNCTYSIIISLAQSYQKISPEIITHLFNNYHKYKSNKNINNNSKEYVSEAILSVFYHAKTAVKDINILIDSINSLHIDHSIFILKLLLSLTRFENLIGEIEIQTILTRFNNFEGAPSKARNLYELLMRKINSQK